MRYVVACIFSCLFCVCAVRAQDAPVGQQFKALSEEIEGWKKEMTRAVASRVAVEPLLRLGVAFQKDYADAADGIAKTKPVAFASGSNPKTENPQLSATFQVKETDIPPTLTGIRVRAKGAKE